MKKRIKPSIASIFGITDRAAALPDELISIAISYIENSKATVSGPASQPIRGIFESLSVILFFVIA